MGFTLAGEIIYKALVPTLRMVISITIGFIITRRGLFTAQGARGVSMLTLNVGLPALLFSSIVDAFNLQNIAAFGSLALCAFLYLAIGAVLSFIIREVFYVPQDFQWGIIVMGTFSNWGNLPNAIVQTMALNSPFNGAPDVSLGVAYNSVFMLIMNVMFFSFGASKLCGLDFHPDRLERPDRLPVGERWASRMISLRRWMAAKTRHGSVDEIEHGSVDQSRRRQKVHVDDVPTSPLSESGEKNLANLYDIDAEQGPHAESAEEPGALRPRVLTRFASGTNITRKTSRAASISSMLETTRPIQGTLPPDVADPEMSWQPTPTVSSPPLLPITSSRSRVSSLHQPVSPVADNSTAGIPTRRRSWPIRFLKAVWDFQSPVTLTIMVALPCALIQPVKALFVVVDGLTGASIPNAPDGDPPLAFLLETASFLGGLTVPCTLILLGAGFARLQVPKDWHSLPLSAMFAVSAAKMVLVPLVGVFLVQRLHGSTDLFPTDDKMRIFVAILSSGTPAAVNQLVVTQLYNPEGTAQTLSMFLLPQYVLMPIFSTALAAIALYITIRSTS